MELIADILLLAGALGAASYCFVLSRRLRRFTGLEGGMAGAIAVLSAQVDELTRTLARAEAAAKNSAGSLDSRMQRADEAVKRLEVLLASLHDLPEPETRRAPAVRFVRRRSRRLAEAEA